MVLDGLADVTPTYLGLWDVLGIKFAQTTVLCTSHYPSDTSADLCCPFSIRSIPRGR